MEEVSGWLKIPVDLNLSDGEVSQFYECQDKGDESHDKESSPGQQQRVTQQFETRAKYSEPMNSPDRRNWWNDENWEIWVQEIKHRKNGKGARDEDWKIGDQVDNQRLFLPIPWQSLHFIYDKYNES